MSSFGNKWLIEPEEDYVDSYKSLEGRGMISKQPELPDVTIDAIDADGNPLTLVINGESTPQHSISWANFGYNIELTTDSEEHTRQLFELLKFTRIVDMD